MVPFAMFPTAVDLDIAPRSRFAKVGQFGEVLPSDHQQIQFLDNFDGMDLLSLDVLPFRSLFPCKTHPK
jgi:hypothetical protein